MQGPGENAGIIDVGDGWACAFKIESHNHPSYIEPYQGAATGVGGILRDIFTMNARPLAVMDSLRFGPLDEAEPDEACGEESSDCYRHRARRAGYGNCFGFRIWAERWFETATSGNPAKCVCARASKTTRSLCKATGEESGDLCGRRRGAWITAQRWRAKSSPKARGRIADGRSVYGEALLGCLEAMATGAVLGIQDMARLV